MYITSALFILLSLWWIKFMMNIYMFYWKFFHFGRDGRPLWWIRFMMNILCFPSQLRTGNMENTDADKIKGKEGERLNGDVSQHIKHQKNRMFELPLNGSVNLLHLQLIFETNRSFPLLMEGLWQPSREQEGSNAFQLSHLQKTLCSILLFKILSVLIFSSSILFVVCCQVCFSTFT